MSSARPTASPPIRVGVSACLMGQQVRYDGQHKRDGFVCDELAGIVQLVPVCPEVAIGLGIPREPIRLVKRSRQTRLVSVETERDLTEAMTTWAEKQARALAAEGLSGYVLKKDSPSCGMEGVERYPDRPGAAPVRDGVGLFAAALMRLLPNLPVEEEGRLEDAGLRASFVERVFAYHRHEAGRMAALAKVAAPGRHT